MMRRPDPECCRVCGCDQALQMKPGRENIQTAGPSGVRVFGVSVLINKISHAFSYKQLTFFRHLCVVCSLIHTFR
jgi:hypothetical protein